MDEQSLARGVPERFQHNERNAGIDIRSHSFGFIILENMAVLDCGTRECQRDEPRTCLQQRFRRVLRTYSPSRVIAREGRWNLKGARNRRPGSFNALKSEAKRLSVPFVVVSEASRRAYFRPLGARNKRELAQLLIQLCPELVWRLPPKRKPWQSEDERLSIFDAASAVVTFIAIAAANKPDASTPEVPEI